ncbi:pilus assembly protein TadG-related protein [Streptomyces sp. NRRL WC-3549]|uniref:pilus assembly protein TadG-related protein n=1 Tax=Streptomyces sp. NRRL WC-3549 TaxID=1463925 RepID=UPI0004CB1FB8|nr:pilus assembly protein TadG-related protein [Streptomyces sp. NRRL WC-3549]
MIRGTSRETGQAAPLYITALTGLLFLALVFLVFGEADVKRNGAQSAADAAALAAAQESRDALRGDLIAHILDSRYLRDVFGGDLAGTYNGCAQAYRFAAQNGAGDVSCAMVFDGRWGFRVQVKSDKKMSVNLIPGIAGKRAAAQAVAVVEPRCVFQSNGRAEKPPAGAGEADGEERPSPGKLVCEATRDWIIDPENLGLMPSMVDLFTVRLSED